jgi:hypothetical protein
MSYTFPWRGSEAIHAALVKRGYAHRIDKNGLTVEWDDPKLAEAELVAGIKKWVKTDHKVKTK